MPNPIDRPGLPPLNGLRAFEAAARLQSFTAAAEELHVTPAAVAQQIKALEAWVGLRLFDRHVRGVTLNATGQQALPNLTRAFDLMGDTMRSLSRKARPKTIRIAALPSIAQFWLAPRLALLRAQVPGLEVSVTARETPPNLNREAFDLGLFLEAPSDDRSVIVLEQDQIFPVCAPAVAAQISTPQDLAEQTLLNDQDWIADWPTWHAAVGIGDAPRGPVFSLYGLALQEASNGAGVLIGHSILVQPHLDQSTLTAPFEQRVTLPHSLCLRVSAATGDDPVLRQVVAALKSSAVPD